MLVSTKGRYALRVMIDLAEHNDGSLIKLKDIAQRQDVSEKYLESIMVLLSKADLVYASRGKGGGYRLNKSPSEYSIGSILKLTEGSLAPVACMDEDKNCCDRETICKTRPMWHKLDSMIDEFFESISLAQLL